MLAKTSVALAYRHATNVLHADGFAGLQWHLLRQLVDPHFRTQALLFRYNNMQCVVDIRWHVDMPEIRARL